MPLLSGPPPTGVTRLLARVPLWLYRMGRGGILGGRFLLLEHIGRKSGRTRQTVLEVVGHDAESGRYVVASGWGTRSDWFQNVERGPRVTVQVGRHW